MAQVLLDLGRHTRTHCISHDPRTRDDVLRPVHDADRPASAIFQHRIRLFRIVARAAPIG